jgi:branched-chain amino acid transport system permease protein
MDWSRIIINALEASIGLQTVVFALAAIGLNVHFGYTGLLNFGQSGFLAVAAYGLAVTVATFDLPMWLGILIGLAGAVVLALLLGIPTLRLRADYLAIVTIAAAEIIRLTVRSVTFESTFGGSDGRQAFAGGFYDLNPYPVHEYNIGNFGFNERQMWILTVGWILVALSCLVVYLLMRSPWGRVLKAIREDEDAVRSLGKNVYAYKMQSLIIGGVLGCLGGFVYALGQASIQPDIFGTDTTFFAYTILILGGAARSWAR